MASFESHEGSSSRGILVENKVCQKCHRRASIRAAGATATNPYKLYYKCDDCSWFQWCKVKFEEGGYEIASGSQVPISHTPSSELTKKLEKQQQDIAKLKGKVEELSKTLQFAIKVGLVMYAFLLFLVMK